MSSERNKLTDYFQWLFRTYEEIKKEQRNLAETPCSILRYSKNKHGKYEVEIHLIGKRMVFKKSPEEILADDRTTEAFSKKDIRLLTYLACENEKEPKHQMLGQIFKREVNKIFFRLRHDKTGEEIEKSTEEIFGDSAFIQSLDGEAAYTIGYATANEQVKHEVKKESKHQMLGQIFRRGINKLFFKLRHGETGAEIERNTEEIFGDSNFIKSLNAEDAYTIGYATANEQVKKEH